MSEEGFPHFYVFSNSVSVLNIAVFIYHFYQFKVEKVKTTDKIVRSKPANLPTRWQNTADTLSAIRNHYWVNLCEMKEVVNTIS